MGKPPRGRGVAALMLLVQRGCLIETPASLPLRTFGGPPRVSASCEAGVSSRPAPWMDRISSKAGLFLSRIQERAGCETVAFVSWLRGGGNRTSPRGEIILVQGVSRNRTCDLLGRTLDSLEGVMSRFYRFVYAVGLTPWEADAENVAPELRSFVGRVEDGLEPPFGAALDLGCGRGRWAVELAERGWDVTGIDAISKAVLGARRRLRRPVSPLGLSREA